jgi:hypothetical protein
MEVSGGWRCASVRCRKLGDGELVFIPSGVVASFFGRSDGEGVSNDKRAAGAGDGARLCERSKALKGATP